MNGTVQESVGKDQPKWIAVAPPNPPLRAECHSYNLHNNNKVSLIKCRTERYKKSFFPTMAHALSH